MNSMERVMTALSYQEPDRVPLFLNITITGAKELGMSIKEYYSSADHVVKGQLLMNKKYSNDMVTNFLYSAAEIQAWGGEVIFSEDGPPMTGEPFIKKIDDIYKMEIPNIKHTAGFLKELEIIEKLKKAVKEETPIIGAVTAPFSLPVMQMGFEKYLELIYFRKDAFHHLMKINEAFCAAWANAQLAAGATAIGYANPLASPNIIERETYISTGFEVDKRTIARIKGPVATKLASGIALPVMKDLMQTGTKAVNVSVEDDIVEVKKIADKKVTIIGNLNAVDMINWDKEKTRKEVKDLINKAAVGGGFILSDNHGEIPWQVSEDVLLAIGETIKEHGTYPI